MKIINPIHPRNGLYLAGVILVILGSFSPWRCWGDFVWYCSAGIDISLAGLSLVDPRAVLLGLVAIVVGGLIVSAIERVKRRMGEIVVVATLLALPGLLPGGVIVDHGGHAVVLLSGIPGWCALRWGKFSRSVVILVIVDAVILMGISLWWLVPALFNQVGDKYVAAQYGLIGVVIGSLIMLIASVWEHCTNRQCAS